MHQDMPSKMISEQVNNLIKGNGEVLDRLKVSNEMRGITTVQTSTAQPIPCSDGNVLYLYCTIW